MGAGNFRAGAGIAGVNPVIRTAPLLPLVTPRAIFYDPSVRNYDPSVSDGQGGGIHPIDQIVATRLTIEQGTSASNPTLGMRVRARFNGAAPDQHQAIAQQEVQIALADLLAAGDVLVLSVVLATDPSNGAQGITVNYQNMRDPRVNPRYPAQNARSATL